MEESETSTAKVSDSAYSNSCNSKSQRSSSKYGTSNSSGSGSSGYGGHPSTRGSSEDVSQHLQDKEHKKKKQLSGGVEPKKSAVETSDGSLSVQSMHVALGSAGLVRPNSPGQSCKASHIQSLQTGTGSVADVLKVEPSTIEVVHEPQVSVHVADLQASKEEKFSAVFSMQNGTILCTSTSLTDVLGFPKDMWLGRFFIDFVHPKDRTAFSAFITAGVADTLVGTNGAASLMPCKESFFCCLRQYRGLKSNGYGVTQREVTYRPFQLSLAFRESGSMDKTTLAPEDNTGKVSKEIFVLVTATVMNSAYKVPEEEHLSAKFVTRHSARCNMSHVDVEAVRYLGYLPQDMLNRSVFDFYHPEDLPFIKGVYEEVKKGQGLPFRSRPYRFRAQNGGYVLLETEWSSFVNPWSKKLEVVIGQHRVLKGPPNPDVFAFVKKDDELPVIVEEVVKESKVIQEEIIAMLKEMVCRSVMEVKQQVSKRCKELATFMESLMGEMSKPDLNIVLPQEEQSISEHGSEVMLGEISPHHDYCDGKSSTETPPSYNQLNYNDNIQRFFESRPKTTSDDSAESKMETNRSPVSTDEEGKCVESTVLPSGCSSSVAVTDSHETASEAYKPPHLTEALLCRHNEDMEKWMVQKHREQRGKGERDGKVKENRHKASREKSKDQNHGVKRSGSHSCEGEPLKSSKYTHGEAAGKTTAPTGITYSCNVQQPLVYHGPTQGAMGSPYLPSHPQVNLWPPFSVAPVHPTMPVSTSCMPSMTQQEQQPQMHMSNMFPVYYIPGSSGTSMSPAPLSGQGPSEHPGLPSFMTQQVPYMPGMPGMMYQPMQPMYGMGVPSQMMYHPGGMVMLQPTLLPTPATRPTTMPPVTVTSSRLLSALPQSSKKAVSLGRAVQSCEEEEWKRKDNMDGEQFRLGQDDGKAYETSYSSFYSFLKTDKSDSDESMTGKPEDMAWGKSDRSVGNPPTSKPRPVLMNPPWVVEDVITSDLIYRYKLDERQIADVLEADFKKLKKIYQPFLVNDQLSQLYQDMELDGRTTLEEGFTSSGSSGEELPASCCPFTQPRLSKEKKKRQPMEYSKLVMIFEENAPFPPPLMQ